MKLDDHERTPNYSTDIKKRYTTHSVMHGFNLLEFSIDHVNERDNELLKRQKAMVKFVKDKSFKVVG